MDRLLLYSLNLQWLQLLIKDLTQIHDDTFVDLLPQVGSEDLDEGNLQRGDFPVHEDTSQIELHLETDVNICAINCWAPPQSEPTVRNLVQTGPLSVGQLFVSHGLLETGGLLPEETYHHIRLKQCS